MIVVTILNAMGFLVLSGVSFLTLRQIGLILLRLGPVGARSSDDLSPRLGENIAFHLTEFDPVARGPDKPVLYLFLSKTCSVCRNVRQAALDLSQHWSHEINIVLIYDKRGEVEPLPKEHAAKVCQVIDGDLRNKLDIRFLPFGIRVDKNATVIGRGLINNASHVESLLEIDESDYWRRSVPEEKGQHAIV